MDKLEIRKEIEKLLLSTKRKGIKKLVLELDSLGYFEAPASTMYHLNYAGGLAEHSLNVCKLMNNMAESMNAHQFDSITNDSIIITSLLHDLGKSNFFDKSEYIPNILKNGSVSDKKPWVVNKSRPPIPHAVASIQIASQYIQLTQEEMTAILYHDGLYVANGRDIQNKEQPLQLLLHWADMWNARFIETIGSEESDGGEC